MTNFVLSISILSLLLTSSLASVFIETSCKKTRYPDECVKTLTPEEATIGENPLKIAERALSITMSRSQQLDAFLNKQEKKAGLGNKERSALKDCLDGMDDIIDQLTVSVNEMGKMAQPSADFMFQKSNVQTWVSAVLTDHSTCVEGFVELGVANPATAEIRDKVVALEHDTSNALALINNIQKPK